MCLDANFRCAHRVLWSRVASAKVGSGGGPGASAPLEMASFESFDGVRLSYEMEGDGPAVLLLHGFASDSYNNWIRSGISDELVQAGLRPIMLDQRGHGASEKPHEEEAYAEDAMRRDAQALLDHLGVEGCLAAGYSMGARNTLELLLVDRRIKAAVLAGIGSNMLTARDGGSAVADAMLVEDKSTITNRLARSFRDFADLTRADRVALAALQRQPRPAIDGLGEIEAAVLILCGDNDPLVGGRDGPQQLADAIPGAEAVVVGGTHLNVVNNPEFHRAFVSFLEQHRGAV